MTANHTSKPDVSAIELERLLAKRHSEDIYVPECKDGPTQTGTGHLRLDAWAMRKSWSRPCMWGYEIKVSRSDFVGDNKWTGYLPLCNEFYFVCPRGVIEPMELPPDVGLLWASKTGNKLFSKRKAVRRDIEFPSQLVTYILMCRAKIQRNEINHDKAAHWQAWLAERDEHRNLGRRVAIGMAEEHVVRTSELEKAYQLTADCQPVIDWLKRHGLPPTGYSRAIKALATLEPFLHQNNIVDIEPLRRTAHRARLIADTADEVIAALSKLDALENAEVPA